eukprot:symbB.v1.2.024148.t1/scaffold2264.1/size174359/3
MNGVRGQGSCFCQSSRGVRGSHRLFSRRSSTEDCPDESVVSFPYTEDWSGFLSPGASTTVVVLCSARPGNVGATYRLCCFLGISALIVVGLTKGKALKAVELSEVRKTTPGVDKLTQLVAPSKEEAFEVQLWSGEHGWGRTRVPHQVGISIGHPKKVVNSKGIRTPKMAETFRNCLDNQWLVVG